MCDLFMCYVCGDDEWLNMVIDVDSYNNIKLLVVVGFGYFILFENVIVIEVVVGWLLNWLICCLVLCCIVYLVYFIDWFMINVVIVVLYLVCDMLCDLVCNCYWIGVMFLDYFEFDKYVL